MQLKKIENYKKPEYKVKSMFLEFFLNEKKTKIKTKAEYYKDDFCKNKNELFLDGNNFKLNFLKLNGVLLEEGKNYKIHDGFLELYNIPDKFTLEMEHYINPLENKSLEGLYISDGIFCTQCEAEGFRNITYFQDRPDIMTVYTVSIIANDNIPVVLSNGNLIKEEKIADNLKHYIWHDPFPKPSYLFALVAGNLKGIEDVFKTKSGKEVRLKVYSNPENINDLSHSMDSLKLSMKWDEDKWGLEYDLDVFHIVAVNYFNMGAMENKSLNIFNSKCIVANIDKSSDDDFEIIESIVGHEYFHNWSGNRVTCRDWFQLSLKEGLTVFRDQEFTADMRSKDVSRIKDVKSLKLRQFVEDKSPLSHPVRPNSYVKIDNFYTATVYQKGAEVIRMLKNVVGDKDFYKGAAIYFKKFDGMAVTCDDWVSCIEEASSKDLTKFKRWYSQSGTPKVTVSDSWDAESKKYKIKLIQNNNPTKDQEKKENLVIPLNYGLVDDNGKTLLEVSSGILDTVEKEIEFSNMSSKPILSFNRAFASPIDVDISYDYKDYSHLYFYDTDNFNRWESGQKLMLELFKRINNNEDCNEVLNLVSDGIFRILEDNNIDYQYKSLAITPPSINDIFLEYEKEIDPIKFCKSYDKMYNKISNLVCEKMLQVSTEIDNFFNKKEEENKSYSHACNRYIQNIAYEYMAKSDNRINYLDYFLNKYEKSKMIFTTNYKVLSLLYNNYFEYSSKEMINISNEFRNRHSQNIDVLDKWFLMYASKWSKDTLGIVKNKMHDNAFDLSNPNKARSLIGGFINNPYSLHLSDGYDFSKECILQIDKLNPHMSSMLVKSLCNYRIFIDRYSKNINSCLKDILSAKNISENLKEVVLKSV